MNIDNQMNLVYSEFLSLESFWYFFDKKYKKNQVSSGKEISI